MSLQRVFLDEFPKSLPTIPYFSLPHLPQGLKHCSLMNPLPVFPSSMKWVRRDTFWWIFASLHGKEEVMAEMVVIGSNVTKVWMSQTAHETSINKCCCILAAPIT